MDLKELGDKIDKIDDKIGDVVKVMHQLRTDFEVHKAVMNEHPKVTSKQMAFITTAAGLIGAACTSIISIFQ